MGKFLVHFTHVREVQCEAVIEAKNAIEAREKAHTGEIIEEIEMEPHENVEIISKRAVPISDDDFVEWKTKNHHLLYEEIEPVTRVVD